jgi:Beta-lactamase
MNRSRTTCSVLARAIPALILLLAAAAAFEHPAPAEYTDDTALAAGRRGERVRQVIDAVSVQDPVAKFLGDKGWTKAEPSRVRIGHLLSHTSGLGSYFNEACRRMARQLLRRVDEAATPRRATCSPSRRRCGRGRW